MKKTKLTRSLLAACSIVALSAVMYGCAHTDSGPSQEELDAANADAAAAAAETKTNADAAAAAAVAAKAAADEAAADAAAAATAAAAAAAAKAAADEAAAAAATAATDAAAAAAAKAAADEAAAAAATAATDAAAAAKAAADEAAAAAAADLMTAEDAADDAQEMLDEAAAKAASATATALKAALGLSRLEPLTDTQPPDMDGAAGQGAVPSITPAGVMLGFPAINLDTGLYHTDDRKAEDALAEDADTRILGARRSPRMAPGDSAGMLGDWAGTHYSKTYPRSKRSHSAVAFRNRGDAVMTPFAAGASLTLGTAPDPEDAAFISAESHFEAQYSRATRTLQLDDPTDDDDNDPAASFDIEGDMFPTAGTSAYTLADAAVGAVQSVRHSRDLCGRTWRLLLLGSALHGDCHSRRYRPRR